MNSPNRKQRRAMEAAERRAARSSADVTRQEKPQVVPRPGDVMTFEWERGDGTALTLALKCVGANPERNGDTIAVQFVPLEDSIHPVSLGFPAPYVEFSTDGGKSIRHYWEKLTYLFGLPSPADFPTLAIPPDDRVLMERFIQTCRDLAGFSVINRDTALTLTGNGKNDWKVETTLPSKESIAGTAVTFRQLHSNQDKASFDIVKRGLFLALKHLPEAQREATHATVVQWAQARGALMNHTLTTLVCRKVSKASDKDPVSFRDIRPEDLIQTYNYGGTIHFGEHRQALVDLTNDPTSAAYHSYAYLLSIDALTHLYFGFAALLESALGWGSKAQVTTLDALRT
ncbi:hypothetical protein [Nocardia sp. NPDC046763]|uniref:hypothetical protein n=1 Tax=Nocardia sp. NPDC046763 TaxID=3155256 RepID=UPI0033CBDEC6